MIHSTPLALLAGGLATRMRPLTETLPKSMLEVADEPFIAHQLRLFRRQGIEKVVICAGHLGEQIQDHVGTGARFGLAVEYSFDGKTQLGTGGAILNALPRLGDTFMVVYGDSWLDTNYAPILEAFHREGKPALMTVFRNQNAWDTSNVEFDGQQILNYDKRAPTPKMEYIDWGLGVLRADIFSGLQDGNRFDLADLYGDLVKRKLLSGYCVKERFHEIGSKAGLAETDSLLRNIKG